MILAATETWTMAHAVGLWGVCLAAVGIVWVLAKYWR